MSTETVEAWLTRAAGLLRGAGVDDPRFEARLLLAGAAGWGAEGTLAHRREALSDDLARRADAMLERRRQRQPASQILGTREFWGLEFEVTPEVLDPRADSETVVTAALEVIGNRAVPLRVLDMGTGTGCLLLALLSELPNARGLGVDVSPPALEIAQANSVRLEFSHRTKFAIGNWGEGLSESFDVIIANPPYIPTEEIAKLQPEVARWEPRVALDGGADGLDAYRKLAPEIARLLVNDGFAVVEIDSRQVAAVSALCQGAGLAVRRCVRDLAGRERCLMIEKDIIGAKKNSWKNDLSRLG
jgi:release factor glutamine methyltransferase